MFSFGKPSKNAFAKQLLQALEDADPSSQFEFDEENFQIIRQDQAGSVSLGNIYKEHCTLKRAERDANIVRLASVFLNQGDDLPSDFDEARSHLRPKIWSRATFDLMELRNRLEAADPMDVPLFPLGSHLYSSLVYDTENAMRSLSKDDLDQWGVTYYEAFEIACRNLEESSVMHAQIGDGFYSSVAGDNYDSSRVLLIERIKSMEVNGDHIAVVPQRDAMYVAGTADEESLKIMFDLTDETSSEEIRPLCPLPLILKNGEWEDWSPPRNHVLRAKFDDLELCYLAPLYGEQKSLLDQIAEFEEMPFAASYSVVQLEGTDDLLSYSVVGEGVDTLLPKSQYVIFMTEAGIAASGRWDYVLDVLGSLLALDDSIYPPRFRIKEFPSQELLDEVGMIEPFNE